ncbi:50S ribosomal protein L21 [Marinicella sp. W31]|uniref:50S ribosomal protein L21 n=1 Tax=Marinicella sp. W31 TaxID=3023713 RepID=UPI0037579829
MHAVVATGGKQYRVKEGDVIKVETLAGEAGDTIVLEQVLMLSDGEKVEIGTPLLDGKSVEAEVLGQGRHKKVKIIKFRRRKHHMKQMGHRQNYTALRITKVG